MKTSNKLILAAVLLLLLALTAYNYMLKAEYTSGKYKNPYSNFVALKFNGFDTVDVNSTSAVNVKFVQGPFSVKVDGDALAFTKIKQEGRRLSVSAIFKQDYIQSPSEYVVVISCPKLAKVNANAVFISENKKVIDTIYRDDWHMRQNLIEGFNEDSLSVRQYYGNSLILSGNHIRVLDAVTGLNPGSFSKLTILNNNRFQQATVGVLNRSSFLVDGRAVQNLSYSLADSAKITLTGAVRNLINNVKSPQK